MKTFYANKFYFVVSHNDYTYNREIEDLYDFVRRSCDQQNLMLQQEYYASKYLEVKSQKDFNKAISLIRAEAKSGKFPYLHIDAHGSNRGVSLTSGATVHWNELIRDFTEINTACKNNLFVSFASCWGGSFMQELMKKVWKGHEARSPVGGFIGPSKNIDIAEWEKFYSYFNVLLDEKDLNKAYSQLQEGSQDKQIYVCTTSEILFKDFIDIYIEYITVPKYQSRSAYLDYLLKLETLHFQHSGRPLTSKELQLLFKMTTDSKHLVEALNKVQKNFYMIDLYPENSKRFDSIGNIDNWDAMVSNLKKSLTFQLF